MTRFGVHIDPPLADIPFQLSAFSLNTFQTTLRDPRRLSKEGVPDEEDQAAFQAGMASFPDSWGIAHASMLTSLGSPDPRIRNGSMSALAGDANLAAKLNMQGVCFHVGYQKGHDSRDDALDAVIYKLKEVLARLKPGARVLLENGCEGTELGQSIEELGRVAHGVEMPADKIGVVLDTCHLHVAGFDLSHIDAPQRLADEIYAAGIFSIISALHLNDAREACGSHRDRHAVPGQGTIGEGLIRLLAHPFFHDLPVILEMSTEAAMQGIEFLNDHFSE